MELLETSTLQKWIRPLPLLNVVVYWKSSKTEACANKLSQILANIIDNEGRGLVLEFMYGIVLKNKWKIKGGYLFYLNSLFLMFEVCEIVWLIMCLLDDFDPQKNWSVKSNER